MGKLGLKAGEGKSSSFLPVWLALGTGLLLFLSFPGAAGFWPLAWVALVPLLLAVRNVSPGRAARLGLLAGMVHYVSLLYWIVIVLGRYGYLPLWASVPAMLLLALYMSGYLALFCFLISRVWKQQETLAVWAGPLLWVGLDFIRSFLFSGFPWQDLAYSQYKALLLIQTADLTGHFGITFHIVLVNSVTALLLGLWRENISASQAEPSAILMLRTRNAWRYAVLPTLCILLLVMFYNFLRYHQVSRDVAKSPRMKIAVIQGNMEQDQKWSPAMRLETIDRYTELSKQAIAQGENPPDLIVWPETALPFLVSDNPYFNRLKKQLINQEKIWLLSGAPFYEKAGGNNPGQTSEKILSYNSAYVFNPEGEIAGRYDKQHLVPFGEYVPLSKILPLPGPLVENIGDFSGGRSIPPLSCQGAEIGVLICFESIFPELARDWTSGGADLLVNITNDAWFGRSSAPWQHLSMTVFRALENRRSLARSANTGVSALIDPLGRMSGVTALFQPAFLVEEVPLLQEKTVYVSFGHYFGLLCLLACLPVAYVFRKSNKGNLGN
ncbi:MAG: apolipoprotein N-acyltransferase [Deltaproteobacteria bacterium]|jgi:apolipoprotein N-acyltransferase|nr:apolipoprotein N-acyltransferase [Deltaproteobacteria bacterium]